ncbi:MAG: 2,3-bisphosphoglycerate-independent phosphoglycerate mutase [Anaerolineae bacterium]|nr:2,3-bisphosphoglycerate-independent phosphoglycerate mutase [Anaerolineae bacterium]
MVSFEVLRELHVPAETKIVMLVMDGLGGLPLQAGGKTELETARTPNMDRLASEGICGLSVPVAAGITPGSGPSHLALFGYDPFRYEIGRGVLEALGIGFELGPDDLAARGNFCTVDEEGRITDRRAGRIPTEKCAELVEKLRAIRLPDVEVFVEPVKDYRFVLVLRGKGLSDKLTETDPQQVGKKPLPVTALSPDAERTAQLLNTWIAEAAKILAGERPANMLTLRGLAKNPGLPPMSEVYGLRAAAIATYPMYRGVSRLVGMTVLEVGGETLEDEVAALRRHWADFDFFYVHVKKTDSAGEDGDFQRKVEIIEHVDTLIPDIMALNPDVVIITGDHSTPALLRSHSWHPVPTILWSRVCRADAVREFGETACSQGGLGVFPATDLMPLALANAGRLTKFGA